MRNRHESSLAQKELTSQATPQFDSELDRTSQSIIKWGILVVFVISLLRFFVVSGIGWNNGLSDVHGFRQTQTAITAYYLAHGGPFLRYETPVFGTPWSIPFEFPLYQWLVAVVSNLFRTPLDQTGRFISECCFGLTLISLWSLLAEFRVRRLYRLVFLTMVLVSPLYVFWSRTFMIESMALCLCMSYLLFMVRYNRTRSIVDFLLTVGFGALGALVKATTFPAFALAGGLICLFVVADNNRSDINKLIRRAAFLPVVAGIPLVIALFWVRYTDHIKELSDLGVTLTSYNLRPWNFGPFSQKFALQTWLIFFLRIIPDVSGTFFVVLLPAIVFFLERRNSRFKPFLICALSFLAPFLIFTNLHFVHSYYSYANGIFLIMALSWCIIALLEGKPLHRYLGIGTLLLCTIASIGTYSERYLSLQRQPQNTMTKAVQAIEATTNANDVLLIYGMDWSSEIPYYTQRRALMWPNFMKQDFKDPKLKLALHNLDDKRIGALVVAKTYLDEHRLVKDTLTGLNLQTKPSYEDGFCAVYLPQTSVRQR